MPISEVVIVKHICISILIQYEKDASTLVDARRTKVAGGIACASQLHRVLPGGQQATVGPLLHSLENEGTSWSLDQVARVFQTNFPRLYRALELDGQLEQGAPLNTGTTTRSLLSPSTGTTPPLSLSLSPHGRLVFVLPSALVAAERGVSERERRKEVKRARAFLAQQATAVVTAPGSSSDFLGDVGDDDVLSLRAREEAGDCVWLNADEWSWWCSHTSDPLEQSSAASPEASPPPPLTSSLNNIAPLNEPTGSSDEEQEAVPLSLSLSLPAPRSEPAGRTNDSTDRTDSSARTRKIGTLTTSGGVKRQCVGTTSETAEPTQEEEPRFTPHAFTLWSGEEAAPFVPKMEHLLFCRGGGFV